MSRRQQVPPTTQPRSTSVPFSVAQASSSSSSSSSTGMGMNTDPITNAHQSYRFYAAPQSSVNESLFANFLPTAMTRPVSDAPAAGSANLPQHAGTASYPPSRALQLLHLLGTGGTRSAAAAPAHSSQSTGTTNHSGNHSHSANVPLQTMVMQHQMTLLPMGQRGSVLDNFLNQGYSENPVIDQYYSVPSTTTTGHGQGGSVNHNNNNDSTVRSLDDYFLEMFNSGRNTALPPFQWSNLIPNRHPEPHEATTTAPIVATTNTTTGQTSETAIEITEEEDGDNDDDVMVVASQFS